MSSLLKNLKIKMDVKDDDVLFWVPIKMKKSDLDLWSSKFGYEGLESHIRISLGVHFDLEIRKDLNK